MRIASGILQGAEIRLRSPVESLRHHLGCFWIVEARRGARLRTVPDGCAMISFECRQRGPSIWWFTGPSTTATERLIRYPTTIGGVRLRPGVSFLLTHAPTHALVGTRQPLAALFPRPPLDVAGTAAADQHLDQLEQFLLTRLSSAELHPVVLAAITQIAHAKGRVRVPALARACGVGPRHLCRLLRLWIGYGPKRFATVMRFQEVLGRMRLTPDVAAAAIADDVGYFDQPHLSRDLIRFAHTTPVHLASRHIADLTKTACE